MIQVTRLNDSKYYINCDLIEFIEETPDTIIKLTTGTKVIVKESVNEILQLIISYKKELFSGIYFINN